MTTRLYDMLAMFVLAQAENGGGEAPAGDGGGGGAEDGGGGGGIFGDPLFMMAIMAVLLLFYFMVVMPQRRKQKELESSVKNLKENDRIVTIGGIVGTIVSFSKDKDEVVIRVDEKTNTKIRLLTSALRPPEPEKEKAEEETKKS